MTSLYNLKHPEDELLDLEIIFQVEQQKIHFEPRTTYFGLLYSSS